jgi:hypothetical protein
LYRLELEEINYLYLYLVFVYAPFRYWQFRYIFFIFLFTLHVATDAVLAGGLVTCTHPVPVTSNTNLALISFLMDQDILIAWYSDVHVRVHGLCFFFLNANTGLFRFKKPGPFIFDIKT